MLYFVVVGILVLWIHIKHVFFAIKKHINNFNVKIYCILYIQNQLKILAFAQQTLKNALKNGGVLMPPYILFFEISFLKRRLWYLQEKSKIPLFDVFEILWVLWKTSKITLFSRFCRFSRFCKSCQKLVWDIYWRKFVTFSGTFIEKIFFQKLDFSEIFTFKLFNYMKKFWIYKKF